jgi:PHD-finger
MISDSLNTLQKFEVSSSPDIVEVDRTFSQLKAPPGFKTPLLPDLSASTHEILARVQAESAANVTHQAPALPNNIRASIMSSEYSFSVDSTPNSTAQFQRPRMASGMFDKSKLKSAFASALIPKSKTLPSQPLSDHVSQSPPVPATSISLNSTLQNEKTPQPATEQPNVDPSPMRSDESTIEVMPSPAKVAPVGPSPAGAASYLKPDAEKLETPKSKMRMSHTYVLPSGEIVNSGKGLGRGRPGIKRGPRKPKSTSTPTLSETKPTSRKRKRSSGDSDIELGGESRSPSPSVSDSGDEYAPDATQTRSGRHVQRPTTFIPPESPSQKVSRTAAPASSNAGKLPIKRKVYRGKEQSALCEHCLRGYGPLKNAIVFCDGCNRCWHQKCHDPMIPRRLVLDPNSEWFCHECMAVKEKAKEAARTRKSQAPPATAEKSTATAPLPSADTARKDYFNSLSKENLVDLLMQASTLVPQIPLWQPPPAPPEPQPTNAAPSPNPASSTKEDAYPTPKNEPSDAEEDDDEYEDEHAKLYPRPGNGVQLPPESEDMHMLLEGAESRTFSHSLREGVVGNSR